MKRTLVVLLSATCVALAADRVPRVDLNSDDTVLAHVVAGGQYWTTSITLANIYDHGDGTAKPFTLRFYDDNGSAWSVPIAGIGNTSVIQGSLKFGASVTYTTTLGGTEKSGWAQLSYDWSTAAMPIWGVFKLNAQPVLEAVVPASKNNDERVMLPFDNLAGYLGLAVVNPGDIPTIIQVTFADDSGRVIYRDTMPLGGKAHTAFQLLDKWPDKGLQGKKGAIWFYATSGSQAVSVLGLRFTPQNTFTSVHTISDPWSPPEPIQ